MEKTSQVELFGGTELRTVEKSSSIKGTVNTGIESFFWPGTERFEKFRLSWNCTTPDRYLQLFVFLTCHNCLGRPLKSPMKRYVTSLVTEPGTK